MSPLPPVVLLRRQCFQQWRPTVLVRQRSCRRGLVVSLHPSSPCSSAPPNPNDSDDSNDQEEEDNNDKENNDDNEEKDNNDNNTDAGNDDNRSYRRSIPPTAVAA